MSYDEYLDMFFKAQKMKCPYRAFMFDVVNSRNQKEYIETKKEKYFELINYIYKCLLQEEMATNTPILLKDENNKKFKICEKPFNLNKYNPMILGDMATFFVHNNSISTEKMLKIFVNGLKKCDINYPFHFNTGVYETNDYIYGGSKLYKGYTAQILEKLSKQNNIIISKSYSFNKDKNF